MILRKMRVIAICVVLAMLLSGCSAILAQLSEYQTLLEQELQEEQGIQDAVQPDGIVKFTDMQYVRPDMDAFEQILLESCYTAENADSVDEVMEGVYAFYDVYDWFCTNYALADIHYSLDLSDTYWEEEYYFCVENVSTADAGLEELYYALADSPFREELESDYFGEDYFDAYDGDKVYDATYLALLEEEVQLQNQYYALYEQAADTEYYSEEYFSVYGPQFGELFVELIAVRQQIAEYAGYDSYPEYAYEMYHYRDYTPQQAQAYLEEIGSTMYDLYCAVNQSSIWNEAYTYCSQTDMFNYVKTASENMGGYVQEAFAMLEEGQLYDVSSGPYKMGGAFEIYLWSYYEPFVFVTPAKDQSDKLTFAHEFGHFANDYVCYGSYAGTDVVEVHSQGMEYLSLLYHEDTEMLEAYKLADCLCTYVEQAAYALFEQQVYLLEDDELTVENVEALYSQIGHDFGFDSWWWDDRDYICVEHFFTSPMYVVSYVVSNDVAFQMYQMEQAEPGAGLEVYQQCLESMDTYLISFTEYYGLESPFAEGRLQEVHDTVKEGLADYL